MSDTQSPTSSNESNIDIVLFNMEKKWMAAHYIKTTAKQTWSRNLNHMHMKTKMP